EGDQYGEVFISAEHETYPVTTQTPSSRLPDHLGANYIEFTPAEAGPKNLVISFDGKDTTDWKIRVVKVNPSGDDEVVEMTLDGDEKGTVTVNNFGTSSTYRQVALIATVTSRSGDDNTYTYSALTSSADTDWTYMVYMNGDSSTTEQEACEELEAMGVVGSSSGDVNIVVQLDRASGGYSGFGNWTGARRFLLAQGDDPASTPVSDLGAVNMGDSITLSGFVTWAAANYPADKYALVVWDRAVSGFPTDAVVTDSTSADSMTFTELKTALVASASALGQDIDVLALDASMMGYLETAYQVKDSAGVLVYSQENLPTGGIPNNDVLTALKLAPTSTAANLGQGFVTAFGNEHSAIGTHTLAALDSTQMAATKTAFDSLVSELNSNIAQEKTDYTGAWVATERFDNGTSTLSRVALDLDNLSESLRGTVSSASLITACQNLETALANLVSNETHGASYSAANGVSIYFPYAPTDKDSGYDSRTSLAADTDWDLFLTTYFTDDTHEDNDTRLTAASVSDGSQTSLSCYDDDWYAVSRSAGEGISVHIAFTHNDRGNLNLHFYDTDGTTILKSSTTSTDDETVNHTSLPGTGTYYIKVVGASASDVNSYDMGIGDPFSMESAATVDRTTIDVTFSETLNSGTVSAADFSVSDETITAVSVDGSTVRLTVTPVLDTEA
ncbi:MAG: clostripain-related cysteine peptidase, partial [bacterium]|nr:clostripain-related cysteine peptidase [bacterium]